MAKKTNWQVLQSKDDHDSMQFRDVYEDQQLERSKIQDKQSPLLRVVITVILTIMVAAMTWVAVGVMQYGMYQFTHGIGDATSTASTGQTSDSGKGKFSATYNPKEPYNYIGEEDSIVDGGGMKTVYFAKDANGHKIGNKLYERSTDVPLPDWYSKAKADYDAKAATAEGQAELKQQEADDAKKAELSSIGHYMLPDLWKMLITLGVSAMFFAIVYQLMMRNLAAQNLMNDTSDINQYQNDQHIALPEEVQRKFDWFPDVGAHSSVQPSSMISHMALTNKGINKVAVAERATEDIKDEDGDVEYLKGEIIRDDDNNALTTKMPMIDEQFMQDLFTASGVPKNDKTIRKFYDPTVIPYNPKNSNRDKQKGFDTVADLINGDWILPEYETQRPAGAYVVDTDPVNTMCLAITRAGKGELAQLVA